MSLYAIVDTTSDLVVNIIEYLSPPPTPLPGLPATLIAVPTTAAEIGWAFANGVFTAPVPPLAQAQGAQIAALQAAYLTASSQPVGFTTAAKVTKSFQADAGSQQILQQTLAGLAGAAATPAGFYWLSADNTQVPMTYADLQGLAAAMLAQGWAAFQKLQTLKSQVNAATTVTAVESVNW